MPRTPLQTAPIQTAPIQTAPIRLALIQPALLVAVAASGCGGDHPTRDIEIVRVLEAPPMRRGASIEERFGVRAAGDTAAAASSAAGERLVYALPAGWTELPRAQFRDVNLDAGDGVKAWVTRLDGSAGGVLLNLNRWRGQLELAPLADADVAALPRRELLGQEALWIDWTRADGGERLVALAAVAPTGSNFARLSGSPEAVGARIEAFTGFCASLRVERAQQGSGDAAAARDPALSDAARGSGAEGLSWTAPQGWTELPATTFRQANFKVGSDVECWLSILGGDGGGLAQNLERWRGEFGLAPFTKGEIEALARVAVLGRPAILVELEGEQTSRDGTALGRRAMLGIVCELDARSVFVKMVGPVDAVQAARAEFLQFCASLVQS